MFRFWSRVMHRSRPLIRGKFGNLPPAGAAQFEAGRSSHESKRPLRSRCRRWSNRSTPRLKIVAVDVPSWMRFTAADGSVHFRRDAGHCRRKAVLFEVPLTEDAAVNCGRAHREAAVYFAMNGEALTARLGAPGTVTKGVVLSKDAVSEAGLSVADLEAEQQQCAQATGGGAADRGGRIPSVPCPSDLAIAIAPLPDYLQVATQASSRTPSLCRSITFARGATSTAANPVRSWSATSPLVAMHRLRFRR